MKNSKILMLFSSVTISMIAAPAHATEIVDVDWTRPDGGVSTGLYAGDVSITVSGVGMSFATFLNDAFYLYSSDSPYRDNLVHQLTFSTLPLTGGNPSENAFNRLVGSLPAYSADHIYNIVLSTGTATPSRLHFGVGDFNYSDNSGGYRVTINSVAAAVPEPTTWAMMLVGFGLIGAASRHRRRAAKVLPIEIQA